MDENQQKLEAIKGRLEAGSASSDDIQFLFSLIERLTKKNEILSQQNMELTQEMENVRSDFGGSQR